MVLTDLTYTAEYLGGILLVGAATCGAVVTAEDIKMLHSGVDPELTIITIWQFI